MGKPNAGAGRGLLPVGVVLAAAGAVSLLTWMGQGRPVGALLGRFFYVSALFLTVYALRPKGLLHQKTLEEVTANGWRLFCGVFLALSVLAVAAMESTPLWRDSAGTHRDQYEEMAEALVQGHIYIDDGNIAPELLAMENPYSPHDRNELGVPFEWDHAFYHGHYYMYFGIVPCLVLFLPFRLLFGRALPTVRATEIFVLLILLGFFVLTYRVGRRYCRKMTWGAYLTVSAGLSLASTWYFLKCPSLYGTAISGGVCFALWGFILLLRALVWEEGTGKGFWLHLVLGALCSAAVFGCRPSVGLFCVVYIPMGISYAKRRWNKDRAHVWKTVAAFCAPFVVVGALLMVYNAVRFDSPFEFGQSYQLTSADQASYGTDFFKVRIPLLLGEMLNYLIFYTPLSADFPYIHLDGILLLFPLLGMGVYLLAPRTREELKKERLGWLGAGMMAAAALVMGIDYMWSPWLERRYCMDFSFIFALAAVFGACFALRRAKTAEGARRTSVWLCALGAFAVVMAGLVFFASGDASFPDTCPEGFAAVRDFLTLR